MAKKFDIIDEIVTANRILAHEGIVDSFGHISVRHPKHKDRYLLSRARAPERIEGSDIMEYMLDGTPLDPKKAKTTHAPYTERYIHGAIYEARPEIMSVVHNHSPSTIPFGITKTKLKPLLHMCASIGHDVPLWDSHDKFGDTALLVNSMAMGRDLAKRLGKGRTALMRGHGARRGRHGHPPRRVHLDLSRGQRQAADAGDADGQDQVSLPRRGRRGDRAHQRLHAQPRLGELGAPRGREGAGEGLRFGRRCNTLGVTLSPCGRG